MLQSSGGFAVTNPQYELAQAFSYTATVDGESLSASISGADSDESASIKIRINAASGGFFSQKTKDALHKAAVANGVVVAGAGVTAVLCTVCSPTVSPAQVLAMETSVLQNGLPPNVVQSLKQQGADNATIAHIGRLVAVQDIGAVAGTYPDKLVDPAVISALQDEATALRAA